MHVVLCWLLVTVITTTAPVLSMSTSNTARRAALVTGATDGIGLTTAKNLAANGIDVIVHGRDQRRIETACAAIRSFRGVHPSTNIHPVRADLSTTHESEKLADRVKSILHTNNLRMDILMHNAGVFSEDFITTPEGLELTLAVNVVAPFILTSHLLPVLLLDSGTNDTSCTPNSRRIVIASSISQCSSIRDWKDLNYNQRRYSAHGAYSESKLLDAMLSCEFAERLQERGYGPDRITSNSLDPGTVNTKMLMAGWGPIGMNVENALGQTWLCTSPDVEGTTGKYFVGRRAARSTYDVKERTRMWKLLATIAPEAAAMWDFDWVRN